VMVVMVASMQQRSPVPDGCVFAGVIIVIANGNIIN